MKELKELREEHVHLLRQPYGSFYSMDSLDLKIIEEVRKRGPSNISEISRVLNVAPSTVSRRLEKMAATLKLRILTNLAYHKIGIRRAIVEIEPEAGAEAELMEKILSLSYWFQSYRILGSFGYLVGFKIPYAFYNAYESMLNSLKEEYRVKHLAIHPLGEIVGVGPCFRNYDAEVKRWRIDWSDIRRSLTESSPIILEDPPGYSMEADPLDVRIMLILESDAQTSMSDIAKITGVSVPTVSNRIKKLTANGLILGYVANILPFPLEDSRLLQLMVEFPGKTEMQTFASGLLQTPFLLSFQKEIVKPTLFARLYLPNREYPSLSDLLRSLVREGFVKGFSVVELDITSEQSRKISVGLLDSKGQWQFG
jgi:DNA-binding Lrp family transcriptional regulator